MMLSYCVVWMRDNLIGQEVVGILSGFERQGFRRVYTSARGRQVQYGGPLWLRIRPVRLVFHECFLPYGRVKPVVADMRPGQHLERNAVFSKTTRPSFI